jgi:hypothetical protein
MEQPRFVPGGLVPPGARCYTTRIPRRLACVPLFDYDNLSDEQVVYQVRVPLSFTRFLRLGFEDSIRIAPRYGCSVSRWRFGQHLEAKGYIARGGQGGRCHDRGVGKNLQPSRRRRTDLAALGNDLRLLIERPAPI